MKVVQAYLVSYPVRRGLCGEASPTVHPGKQHEASTHHQTVS
jgi:hypothetical protein